MTNAEIIFRVRNAKGQLVEIAEGSGVTLKTIQNIYYRVTDNPRMNTLDNLRDYFQRKDTRQ